MNCLPQADVFEHLVSSGGTVVLFVEVMEPLGGKALLLEVHHWGKVLRVCNITLFLFSFSASCV